MKRCKSLRASIFPAALLLLVPASAWALRLVSLAPSVTETLFALGAGGELVGVSTYCDYPPEAKRIDRVGTFVQPSFELILGKKPDLVLAVPSPGNRATVRKLEELGLRVVVVDPHSVEGVLESILHIGRAVGRTTEAEGLVAQLRRRIDSVERRLRGVRPRKVLVVVGRSPLVAVGGGVVQDELLRRAGGINLGAKAGEGWPRLSLEWVLAEGPEVILDASMGSESGALGNPWARFRELPAVREGRVHRYRDDAFLRPGPRIAEALERLAALLHPERMGEADGALSRAGWVEACSEASECVP
ncbi:MAG: hypothetical protein KatS3mg076_0052 [Candidatus Binatia bacterium]|nr:MAG: hypothetical protein KatS3mg076_0052 [Candidatus Binatia bacterium]